MVNTLTPERQHTKRARTTNSKLSNQNLIVPITIAKKRKQASVGFGIWDYIALCAVASIIAGLIWHSHVNQLPQISVRDKGPVEELLRNSNVTDFLPSPLVSLLSCEPWAPGCTKWRAG